MKAAGLDVALEQSRAAYLQPDLNIYHYTPTYV